MEKGWIIGSVTAGNLSIASRPRVHTTVESVNLEMVRLAKANPGKKFVKLKVEAFVQTNDVIWS